jgi:polysaccharide pyruvyl transferase WcaK-like protein
MSRRTEGHLCKKAEKRMKIAHFGTFDVPNYGDLLFPLIAQRRLAETLGATLVSVSPVGGPPVFQDSLPSIGFDAFAANLDEFGGILIGGGNIVRTTPTVLSEYRIGSTPVTAYPDLWLGATALSTYRHVPVCWNAPGVPEAFGNMFAGQLQSCLDRAAYISVRDEKSREQLQAMGGSARIEVVPDTAWEVDALWTREQLAEAFARAFQSRGRQAPTTTLAFHLNDRYLFQMSTSEVAQLLDEACTRQSATAILLAMGRCHGDHELALRVGKKMKTAPLIVDQPASLCEIAACIAHSIAYVGSSMHGFITASAFGVPAVSVATRAMTKFVGLMRSTGLEGMLQEGWPGACDVLASLDLAKQRELISTVRQGAQPALDAHWAAITDMFRGGPMAPADGIKASAGELLASYRSVTSCSVALEQAQAVRRARTAQADLRDRAQAMLSDLRTMQIELKAARSDLKVARDDVGRLQAWLTGLLSLDEAMVGSAEWKVGRRLMKWARATRVSKASDGQELVKQARTIRQAVASWESRRVPPPAES